MPPSFLYRQNNDAATVTADSTLTGLDADDVLFLQKDAFWTPEDTNDGHSLAFSDIFESSPSWDAVGLVGEGLDGISMGVVDSLGVPVGNLITDPDFTSSNPASEWDFVLGSGTSWDFPSSGGMQHSLSASSDEAGIVGLLSIGERYMTRITVSGMPSSLPSNGELRIYHGNSLVKQITEDGTFTIFGEATVTEFFRMIAQTNFEGTVESVYITKATISSLYDAAFLSSTIGHFSGAQTINDPVLFFGNISSDFKIYGVIFDTVRDYPSFAQSDYTHVVADGTINESPSFDFIGSNKLAEKRKIKMDWKTLDLDKATKAAQFVNILAFKNNTLRKLRPFIMIPETDESDCYFAWFQKGQEFSAPLENKTVNNRRISPLTAWARIG